VISRGAQQHWVALDAVFSRTLSPADLAHARQQFGDHVDAVSDVCFQLLLDDLPEDARATAASLKAALGAAWSDPSRVRPQPEKQA
jgi:hypothetical protein